MIIALSFIGLAALALAAGLALGKKAPVGYEDENGFHFGNPTCLGTDAARTIFMTQSSNDAATPDFASVPIPNLTRIQWVRPAVGLAALFVMLLAIIPQKQDDPKPMTFHNNSVVTQYEFSQVENPTPSVARGDSSKFVQKLCQRFSQME